jgi:hypothetical protein
MLFMFVKHGWCARSESRGIRQSTDVLFRHEMLVSPSACKVIAVGGVGVSLNDRKG